MGFLYAFLPALTELVTGIRRPKCGLSTYSAPCLGFFCAVLKRRIYDQSYFGVYQGAQVAICEDRYGPDSLSLHLNDPDASYPAYSPSLESADADAIQLSMGSGPLGRISHPQLPDGFLLAVATFSVVSPFQGDPSGTSVS